MERERERKAAKKNASEESEATSGEFTWLHPLGKLHRQELDLRRT